jgi:hypothetical protein
VKRLLLTLAFSASGILAQKPSSPVVLIQHVTVVNVVTGEEAKEQTVKLQGGRILCRVDRGCRWCISGCGRCSRRLSHSWLMGHACPLS